MIWYSMACPPVISISIYIYIYLSIYLSIYLMQALVFGDGLLVASVGQFLQQSNVVYRLRVHTDSPELLIRLTVDTCGTI